MTPNDPAYRPGQQLCPEPTAFCSHQARQSNAGRQRPPENLRSAQLPLRQKDETSKQGILFGCNRSPAARLPTLRALHAGGVWKVEGEWRRKGLKFICFWRIIPINITWPVIASHTVNANCEIRVFVTWQSVRSGRMFRQIATADSDLSRETIYLQLRNNRFVRASTSPQPHCYKPKSLTSVLCWNYRGSEKRTLTI